MNKSEKLFERLCIRQGFEFSKILEGEIKTPDYQLLFEGAKTFWEVKEFSENDEEKKIIENALNSEISAIHQRSNHKKP